MSSTISAPEGPTAPVVAAMDDAQLDVLMPRPASRLTRWTLGVAATAVVLIGGIMLMTGRLVPNPTYGGSWSSGSALIVNAERTAVRSTVRIPNWSSRDVRLADIDLPDGSVSLISATGRLEPAIDPENCRQDGNLEVCETSSDGPYDPMARVPGQTLPITIPTDRWAIIDIEFVPECPAQSADHAWGAVDADFDFGAGSLPPFGNSVTIEDGLNPGGRGVTILLDGDTPAAVNGTPVVDGVLSIEHGAALAALCDLFSPG